MRSRVIEIRNATYRYSGAQSPALRDVTLHVSRGEFVLVTGPTGSGKSTLLRVINGLIPHFHEGELHGTVRVVGMNTALARPNQMAARVGTVFQFPEEQIVGSKVWRDVAFGPQNLLLPEKEILKRVEEGLAFVGLEELREREVSTLSGGEKQRLALASVLAMRPELLLLDEPAAELDSRGREDLVGLLVRLSGDGSRTLVIADHRLDDLVGVVDRVVVLQGGRVVLDGPPRSVLAEDGFADLGVEVPKPIQVWKRLLRPEASPSTCPLTPEEVTELVHEYREGGASRGKAVS